MGYHCKDNHDIKMLKILSDKQSNLSFWFFFLGMYIDNLLGRATHSDIYRWSSDTCMFQRMVPCSRSNPNGSERCNYAHWYTGSAPHPERPQFRNSGVAWRSGDSHGRHSGIHLVEKKRERNIRYQFRFFRQ